MIFDLNREGADKAQFNMVVELLARVHALTVLVAEIYAKQEGETFKETMAKVEKRVDEIKEEIGNKLDADYGTLDLGQLKKDQ